MAEDYQRSSIQDTTLLDLPRGTYNRRWVSIKRHKDHHTQQEKGRYSETNTQRSSMSQQMSDEGKRNCVLARDE